MYSVKDVIHVAVLPKETIFNNLLMFCAASFGIVDRIDADLDLRTNSHSANFSCQMNWDNQLSSILSAADDSVAKMRERLTSPGKFSKGSPDLFPVRDGRSSDPGLHPVALPLLATRAPMLQQPSSSLPPAVQWADLAAIQTQLQVQSQALESLTKKVQSVERERDSQQRRIRLLEEEICSLREESTERERARERARDDGRRGQSPGTERMMEQWRREIGRELSTLRGHITRATSLSNLEESFSSKLQGEELQHLRRELDQLKARLRGQEDDMLLQQSEVRETRRQYERSCKTLEQVTDTNRTHGLDLAKTAAQHTRTQQEVRQIRVSMSDLRDEVSRLTLREEQSTPAARPPHTSAPPSAPGAQPRGSRGAEPRGEQQDSDDSEDFSPTPSLAEVSSDDLSWLDDHEPAPRQKSVPRVRLSTRSRRTDIAGPSGDPGDDEDDDDEDDDDDDDLDDDDDDVHLGLGSDLSLDDL